jgi:hypothetical protein
MLISLWASRYSLKHSLSIGIWGFGGMPWMLLEENSLELLVQEPILWR